MRLLFELAPTYLNTHHDKAALFQGARMIDQIGMVMVAAAVLSSLVFVLVLLWESSRRQKRHQQPPESEIDGN
jgi:uncharacterized membrane protein YqjE